MPRTHNIESKSVLTSIQARKSIWWIRPDQVVLGYVLPLYILIFLVSVFGDTQALAPRTPGYLTFPIFALGLFGLLMFSLSARMGRYGVTCLEQEVCVDVPRPFALDLLFLLTIIGYAAWSFMLAQQPDLVVGLILGSAGAPFKIKATVDTVPGVTTLTQVGILYLAVYSRVRLLFGKSAFPVRYSWYAYIIIVLGLLRSIIWSERLALIELLIPLVVVYFSFSNSARFLVSFVKRLGPVLGIGAIYLYFMLTEYGRSWVSFYVDRYDSLATFALMRLSAYYYTALNNGAGLLYLEDWPSLDGYYVASWIYNAPMVGSWVTEALNIENPGVSFLKHYADVEFNNMSGIFTVFYDLGIILGFMFLICWGWICGRLYRQYIKGIGIGIYLFPTIYISAIEILRILYVSEGRYTPVWVLAILLYLFGTTRYYINRAIE